MAFLAIASHWPDFFYIYFFAILICNVFKKKYFWSGSKKNLLQMYGKMKGETTSAFIHFLSDFYKDKSGLIFVQICNCKEPKHEE